MDDDIYGVIARDGQAYALVAMPVGMATVRAYLSRAREQGNIVVKDTETMINFTVIFYEPYCLMADGDAQPAGARSGVTALLARMG